MQIDAWPRFAMLLGCLMATTACVTINVYFPAVAAERAADRIIEDVWGESGDNDEQQGSSLRRQPAQSQLASLGGTLLDLVFKPAHSSEPELDISSPAIRRLTQRMEARHRELREWYDQGVVGLSRDGLIAIREPGEVALARRNELRRLVAEENADRNSLYGEIAAANGRPEWEEQIRATFAERWIRNARPGWYYQDDDGNWVRK